jgi:hypothetical protein
VDFDPKTYEHIFQACLNHSAAVQDALLGSSSAAADGFAASAWMSAT